VRGFRVKLNFELIIDNAVDVLRGKQSFDRDSVVVDIALLIN
jgi:hypothetical protein